MDNIIKVTKTDNGNTIDARELYTMLGSKRHFSDWVKSFLTKSKVFEENIDYWIKPRQRGNQKSGRQRIDYYLSVRMAKVSYLKISERGLLVWKKIILIIVILPKKDV